MTRLTVMPSLIVVAEKCQSCNFLCFLIGPEIVLSKHLPKGVINNNNR